ncbi:MAG: 4-(cytidine 5'-diphospho)-2-C-methyl-D-erythritol kinase [Halocynthiibacter sp.]
MTSEKARAKINLTLHVTGKDAAGYHLLDSLVVFSDQAFDVISLSPSKDMSLSVTGKMVKAVPTDGRNLVLKAASLMGATPTSIHLEKNLPAASGIGGGSADAAATLRALAQAQNIPLPAADDVLALGADIPVCLASTPMRMQGIGGDLTPLPTVPEFHMVLVNTGDAVSTRDVFGALTSVNNPPMSLMPEDADFLGFVTWLKAQRNDMQEAAISICPAIADAILALSETKGNVLARMSGSGATCFGIYETVQDADHAVITLRMAHPKWWVVRG